MQDQNVITGVQPVKFGEQELKFPVFGEGAAALLTTDNAKLGAVALSDAFKTGILEESSIDFVGEALGAILPIVFQLLVIAPTELEIEEAADSAYQAYFQQLDAYFAAAVTEKLEQVPPTIEQPTETVTAETAVEVVQGEAAAGNPIAQEVVEQAEVIAETAGVSTEVAMQAIFGMKAAQSLAAKLVRSHVARQRADLQDLTAIADFLDESGNEVLQQLQAGIKAAPAIPATVSA